MILHLRLFLEDLHPCNWIRALTLTRAKHSQQEYEQNTCSTSGASEASPSCGASGAGVSNEAGGTHATSEACCSRPPSETCKTTDKASDCIPSAQHFKMSLFFSPMSTGSPVMRLDTQAAGQGRVIHKTGVNFQMNHLSHLLRQMILCLPSIQ